MKIRLLLFFVVFSKTIFAQTIEDIKENLEKKDFSQFKHLIANINLSDHCAAPDEITYREVLRNYNEIVANVLIFVPTPDGKYAGNCNYYQINLVTKTNQIIKYELYLKNFDDNKTGNYKLVKQYSNDDEIKTFQELYEKSFYRKLNLNELFDNSVTYGKHCGITGVNPEDRDILEQYINSKNREELFYWLTSPSFERKLYGYEGFKALTNKGYILNETENAVISNLKNFTGPVRTCIGCSFMYEGFSEIINQINEKEMDIAMPKKEIENKNDKKSGSGDLKLILLGLSILLTIGLIYKINKK